MAQSEYEMTIEDIREIAAESGISHADFCVGQTGTQLGSEYAAPLHAEIERLRQVEWEAHIESLEAHIDSLRGG